MIKKLKKFIICIIFIFIFVKLFHIGFYQKSEQVISENVEYEKIAYKEFDYGDYKTVNLLHTTNRNCREIAT